MSSDDTNLALPISLSASESRRLAEFIRAIPISLGVWLWNWGKIAEHEATRKYAEMDNPPEVVYNPQHGLYYVFAFGAFVGGLICLYFALMNLFGS